jgi:hypothetical protein
MRGDPQTLKSLQRLPNVGPRTAEDLLRLGIRGAAQLRRRDPVRMYLDLCRKDGVRHDPCLLDVFISLVEFSKGAPARPWWHFTKQRKAMEAMRFEFRKGRKR